MNSCLWPVPFCLLQHPGIARFCCHCCIKGCLEFRLWGSSKGLTAANPRCNPLWALLLLLQKSHRVHVSKWLPLSHVGPLEMPLTLTLISKTAPAASVSAGFHIPIPVLQCLCWALLCHHTNAFNLTLVALSSLLWGEGGYWSL